MRMQRLLAALAAIFATPMAWAHPSSDGGHGVMDGLVHSLGSVEHWLPAIIVGWCCHRLARSMTAPEAGRLLPGMFAAALFAVIHGSGHALLYPMTAAQAPAVAAATFLLASGTLLVLRGYHRQGMRADSV